MSALERMRAGLNAAGMSAEADVTVNRVRVRPVILDAATNSVLDNVGRDGLVIEEALLQVL